MGTGSLVSFISHLGLGLTELAFFILEHCLRRFCSDACTVVVHLVRVMLLLIGIIDDGSECGC
jgi:hypothetical protein